MNALCIYRVIPAICCTFLFKPSFLFYIFLSQKGNKGVLQQEEVCQVTENGYIRSQVPVSVPAFSQAEVRFPWDHQASSTSLLSANNSIMCNEQCHLFSFPHLTACFFAPALSQKTGGRSKGLSWDSHALGSAPSLKSKMTASKPTGVAELEKQSLHLPGQMLQKIL